jgi:hypothetical protein
MSRVKKKNPKMPKMLLKVIINLTGAIAFSMDLNKRT